ncbi:MAG: hypothetical protein SFY66_10740 [Oculatellaceae cyanobacterium bins.114]|nr:hypothetical protein [Oculatellaceae cyanobacterium bins.114]
MKNLIGAIAIVIVGIPVLLRCLADGSININGIVLNVVGTVQEIITRQPASWESPETRQDADPTPSDQGGNDL